MTYDEIKKICKKYNIKNWSINPETGLVDVDDSVSLYRKKLTELPLNFGNVTGSFWCGINKLTTLKGAPHSVGGSFHGSSNKLTTLKGIPKYIGGSFDCEWNLNLPIWEYRWLFYAEIKGEIDIGLDKLDKFLNNNKNPQKRELPNLFTELKKLDNGII